VEEFVGHLLVEVKGRALSGEIAFRVRVKARVAPKVRSLVDALFHWERLAMGSETTMRNREHSRTAGWLRRGAAFTIVVLAVGAAYWLSSWGRELTAPNGGLVVADDNLAFGEVWERKGFVWELLLENPTPNELKILRFLSSCICQKVEPASLVVPPSSHAKVRVTLDLTHREPGQTPAAVREFAEELVPLIEGVPMQQTGWVLRGRVRATLTANPRTIDFGMRLVRGLPFPSETVELKAHTQITTLSATANPLISVNVQQSASVPGQYEIKIMPENKLPAGEFHFDILLKPTRPQGEALPELTIPVRGFVVEDVQAAPAWLLFGIKPIGQTVTALSEKTLDRPT